MMSSLDSAFDSQKFLSQQSISNSQKSTQDVFTPNSGSQERGSEKMSMYEKWLNKRSLYKHTTSSDNKRGTWASCPSQASSLNQPKCNSSNTPHVFDTTHKGTEGRLSLYQTNKIKAYERDERDLMEQIANGLQENRNELKGFASGMKDSMESLRGLLYEELQQTVSSFQDNMKKLQDDIQSSLQVKEQVFNEMEDLKTVVHKKDCDIANLQTRLQVVEKKRDDEFAQFSKTVSGELKLPQEIIANKLNQISEKADQVIENLKVCKENNEIQGKDTQNLLSNIPAFIKDSEKRLKKELKKIEPDDSNTSLKIGEVVAGCFENWLAEMKQLIKQNIDSFTKKKGMELKDAVTQEQRKNLDTCLRKHLQTVSNKLEDVSQMFTSQHHYHESCFQAISGWDFDKIKMSVEECKKTIENGALLLKQMDQRSESFADHLFHCNRLEAPHSSRGKNESAHSSNTRKNNSQTLQIDRPSVENGLKSRFSDWNRYDQQMQHEAGASEQEISNAYSHNHPESTTLDISYQVHQNSSFSSPNEFSEQCSTRKQLITQHSARLPVIDEFVETKKIVMKSKPKVSAISSLYQPDGKTTPSPVAAVKPQIRMNQSVNLNLWKETRSLPLLHNSPSQNLKYDLRKRKVRDVPFYSKPEKKTKLFLNKTAQRNPAESQAVPKGCQRKPDTMTSQNMKPVSKSQKYSNLHDQHFYVPSRKQTFQAQTGHDSFVRDIQPRNISEDSPYNFRDEKSVPSYITWKNSRQNATITTENCQETKNTYEEMNSGISSPSYSVYSIAKQTPLRHISTALSARRAAQSYHHSMIGRETMRNSPHPTLLSDM